MYYTHQMHYNTLIINHNICYKTHIFFASQSCLVHTVSILSNVTFDFFLLPVLSVHRKHATAYNGNGTVVCRH